MRSLWLALLLLIVFGAAFGPSVIAPAPKYDDELVLLSPHWDGIKTEFGHAFEEHWKQKTGRSVKVVWLDLGGTGALSTYIADQSRLAKWSENEGIGADVFFGGGTYEYKNYANEAWCAKADIKAPGGILEHYLSPAMKAIPATVNGQKLRDEQGAWHAACMSGFGFVYNQRVIERAKLPEPQTWADLARPEFKGWISCGDPAKSGALKMAFEVILQAYEWERGWEVLVRMTANAPAFNEGGSSVPRDVSLGQAAAGPSIDFIAKAPMRRQEASHLAFVFPKGMSVITPDPIAIFKNAPNAEVARGFLDFVLSEDGQRLWYQKRGTERGPKEFDLERLPVLPSLYSLDLPTWTIARPFEQGNAFAYDERKGGGRWNIMYDFLRAALIDVHEDLKAAWASVIRHGRVEDLGPALGRPPLAEQTLIDIGGRGYPQTQLNRLRNKWTGWARGWFGKVREAAEKNLPPPEYAPAASEP